MPSTWHEPTVASHDEWRMHGVHLDLGEWAYVLDEPRVIYGPGPYPFYRNRTRWERNPSAPLLTHEICTGQIDPVRVRLSPDVATYAWGNEYVMLEPHDHRALARTCLFAGMDGAKIMVRSIELGIDLRAEHVTIPDRCPPTLRGQAKVKGTRILELLRAARSERDSGLHAPQTVFSPSRQARST